MYETNSSRFVKHGPCSNCGSRDNVAWYESGSGYCFGCGYYHRGTSNEPRRRFKQDSHDREQLKPIPDDISTFYPSDVVQWISKYNLSVEDLIVNNIRWSDKYEQLIYIFYGENHDPILWQARNFKKGTTHKNRFYTAGTPNDVIAAYYPEINSGLAVIVEDCVSGLKCSKAGATGLPCFGSTMSDTKLARIARLYKDVYIWLDSDKFKEALKIEKKLQNLGCNTRVFNTDLDPKCYSIETIKGMIK